MVVGESTRSVDERWRKAVGVCLVVRELGLHKIVDVPNVRQASLASKNVVLDCVKEPYGGGLFFFGSELFRSVDLCDALEECGAGRPWLERPVVSRLHSFDGNILVPSERCSDDALVSENDGIARGGREKALKQRDGRVEDRIAFAASFGTNFNLPGVGKVRVESGDIRWGRGVEIGRPEIGTELVRLDGT